MQKKQQIYHNYAGKIFYPSFAPLAAIGGVNRPDTTYFNEFCDGECVQITYTPISLPYPRTFNTIKNTNSFIIG